MEYDIEKILTMYEDDYNPSSMVPGPRNMYNQGQLVQNTVDGSRPGYGGKDQYVLSDEVKKKIKEKIKLKPGQKWNFYNPKTGKGHTFGVKKGDPNYDIARNLKPGRLEAKLKQAKETYKKIKADPDLLAQKKAYDKERFLRIRDVKNEEANLKYAIDKDFREKKLEWAKQDRIKNPEKYKKKMSDYYAKKGKFPPGNNYKENVWHDMFRSSQKGGQSRFLLVDESGKLLTPDKFPMKDGKVRWDVGGAYKNAKFYDTKTKQFVKFDNTIKGKGIGFEKYLDQKEVGGKGAFKNATYGYKIKDDYKNLSFKDSKGRTISLGKFMQDRLIDGNDFIKSGINVQHADLNNAFWKNEVSLASSNQELKNLEMNVERDLRAANKIDDVKLKNIAKNKALGTFKTKIEKLPGGITKVIEGKTYGTAPTERGLIQAAGKEFGATRYKDFENLLKQLCPKGQASGGRIGYAAGTPTVACGRNQLQKLLFKGGGTAGERSLVQKIISGGGRMAMGMLNPKELLKLKNLVGPGALGIMAAYEAGSITDDVLRLNKPLNEALAGNWLTKSFMPYSEEFAKQKNLLQSGQLTGNQREYALEMMKMEEFMKEGKRIEGLEANKLVEGTLDDNFTFTSDEDMNKAYSDLFGRLTRMQPYMFEEGITGRSLENEAAMNEYIDAQTARTGASKIFGGPQRMVNKAPRPANVGRGGRGAAGKMKLDYHIPGYTPYDKAYTPSDDEILQIYRSQGVVPPTTGYLAPGEGTRVRMGLASQGDNRSIYGSKFSEGGITGLRSKYEYKK